jgi:hypothetical protein
VVSNQWNGIALFVILLTFNIDTKNFIYVLLFGRSLKELSSWMCLRVYCVKNDFFFKRVVLKDFLVRPVWSKLTLLLYGKVRKTLGLTLSSFGGLTMDGWIWMFVTPTTFCILFQLFLGEGALARARWCFWMKMNRTGCRQNTFAGLLQPEIFVWFWKIE